MKHRVENRTTVETVRLELFLVTLEISTASTDSWIVYIVTTIISGEFLGSSVRLGDDGLAVNSEDNGPHEVDDHVQQGEHSICFTTWSSCYRRKRGYKCYG